MRVLVVVSQLQAVKAWLASVMAWELHNQLLDHHSRLWDHHIRLTLECRLVEEVAAVVRIRRIVLAQLSALGQIDSVGCSCRK